MFAVFSCPLHFLPSHSHSFLCCRRSIFSRAFHAVVSGALRVDSGVQPKRFKAIMWRSLQLRKEKKSEPVLHCTKINSKIGYKLHPFLLWWCCKTGNKNQAVLTSCKHFLFYSSVGFVLLGGKSFHGENNLQWKSHRASFCDVRKVSMRRKFILV